MARADKQKVACVVLAAGTSKRFDGAKQLAKFNGKPLIQWAIDSAVESSADYVYLVLGHRASEIVAAIKPGRAQILLNNEFRGGLSTSLKTAISNIPRDCSGVLFMVGDEPFVDAKELDAMIHGFREDPGKLVALGHNGEPRNPVLIPREFLGEISALKGDVGAREIVRTHIGQTALIETKEEKTIQDIDTTRDLERMTRWRAN